MIQHVGLRVEDNLQGFIDSLEIRNQNFHPAIRHQLANLADGFGENARAAQVVVIAIHAGDDRVLQAKSSDGFGHAARLVPLNGAGLAFGHSAKTAAPGADIAQQHEGGGAMVPALADIGTLRRLANRVQSQAAGQFLEIVKFSPTGALARSHSGLGCRTGGLSSICTSWELAAIVCLNFT